MADDEPATGTSPSRAAAGPPPVSVEDPSEPVLIRVSPTGRPPSTSSNGPVAPSAPGPRSAVSAEEPDPSLVGRWIAAATRPVVGWILVALGILAISVAWFRASDEVFPARQIPYLLSGGMLGVTLVFLGGILIGIQDMRRAVDRIARLEYLVGDLHAALLSRPDAPDVTGRGAAGTRPAEVVAVVPGGASFHREDCAVVRGKEGVTTFTVAEAEDQGLEPCKLCEPVSGRAAAASST